MYRDTLSDLRAIADPECRLPAVICSESRSEAGHSLAAEDSRGLQIGTMRFAEDDDPEFRTITHSYVHESFRGRGYGTALYLGAAALAFEDGRRLRSDALVTVDAARVWIGLQSRGVARIQEPFHWDHWASHSDRGWAAFYPLDQI